MKKYLFVITTILLLITSSCEDEQIESQKTVSPSFPTITKIDVSKNSTPMGDRVLGINISDNKNGFYNSFLEAKKADIKIVELNIPWNAIEPKKQHYVDPWGGVFQQISFYGENNIKVSLSLAIINTVKWEVPDDVKLGDDDFVDRFNKMISYVLSIIPDNVTISSISIGNEVDYVLKNDEWVSYGDFVKQAKEHIQSINPNIKVGVKTTVMGGLLGYQNDYITKLNELTDVVMLNYYPQNDKFEVLEPSIVLEHFDVIANTFPQKEIWITEIGYQSGDNLCKSSELKQAEFYHYMFDAWDKHSAQITTIQIDWLHDQSKDNINQFKDYYGKDKALVEYLSTLGLRNYDDTDKMAWEQLLKEIDARNR